MEYTNSQVRELIKEHIHSETDRLMVYDRLVNGYTFERLSEKYSLDVKTVRKRVHRSEEAIFRHLPKIP